jgi:hypothetical protein
MIVEDSEKLPKVASKFYCYVCDYNTSKKSSYDKHLSTDKHKNNENDSKMVVEDSEKSPKVAKYECECGKIYKYDSGYYRHKKKCLGENVIIDNDVPTDKELILMLIKQNSQLIQQNSDLVKNGTHNTTISNNTNSHNKTFNMQFFLNETCKDAMNIMDFVNSIKIQLCDLENVGKVGFVDGISSIIVKNLNLLDETKRPVHCADTKREVMYVKDENKWEKEDEDKKKIRKMIKYVTHKNTKLMKEFREKYPGCEKSESKYSNSYDKLIIEAFGGKGDNDEEKENKIIRKIAKNVVIEKN